MSMSNSYQQQKKAVLLASLASIAIHTTIILILIGSNQGDKVNLAKKKVPIEIKLVETKVTRKTTAAKLKPKAKQSISKKLPKPITQPKPSRVAKQAVAEKQKGEPTGRKPKTKPVQSINLGAKISEKPAVTATSKEKSSGSLSSNTGQQSSQASSSIIPKETPRCRQCREPRIPRRAEKRGEEGYATFRLTISSSGKVIKTQLLASSGHASFINSARKAAMSSTFYPMAQQNTRNILYDMDYYK